MKHEYHEGDEAAQRFEKLANAVFRAPKPTEKILPKKVRTPKKSNKG